MVLMRIVLAGLAAAMLAACAGNREPVSTESISIPYDPYDYDPDDLDAEAQAHCSAYGLTAVYDGETANPQEVRWRYRHYRCL